MSDPVVNLSGVELPAGAVKPAQRPRWERELSRLWEEYCEKRDFLVDMHRDCLANGARTPRLVFLFAGTKCLYRIYKVPVRPLPSQKRKLLLQCLRVVDAAIANPSGEK